MRKERNVQCSHSLYISMDRVKHFFTFKYFLQINNFRAVFGDEEKVTLTGYRQA